MKFSIILSIFLISLSICFAENQPTGITIFSEPGQYKSFDTPSKDKRETTGFQKREYQPVVSDVEYHGNVSSYKFHRPGCRYYDCKNCIEVFNSKKEAISAGYVPCKVCRP